MMNKKKSTIERYGSVDLGFIQFRISRLMQVSEGRWLAKTIHCSPALIYQWIKNNPRSLPTTDHIWKLSQIEAILFELDEAENFQKWLSACGYDSSKEMMKAHLNWLKMHSKEIIIKFPSLRESKRK